MRQTLSQLALRWLPVLAPWAVLVVGLAATAALTISARREMMERDRERFEHETFQLVAGVESHLRRYAQALMGMREWFFAHYDQMTEALWTNYVYAFHAPAHYPGLYNVGFVEKVFGKGESPDDFPELDAHLQRMRQRFGPDYNLHLAPGGVDGYMWWLRMPVVWHRYSQWRRDPVREYQHYGMDLNQNPDLRWAMNWAFGDERPGLSGKQILDPDRPGVTGLLMFLPVYRTGMDRAVAVNLTEVEKRSAPTSQLQEEAKAWRRYADNLRGLIFGGIDMQDFLRHHLETNTPSVTFALYASTNYTPSEAPDQLLFDNRPPTRPPEHPASQIRNPSMTDRISASGRLQLARDLPLYGRNLRFVLEPGPAFASAVDQRTLRVAAGFGVATTLLLSGFIAYQARVNRNEKAISGALRQSEAHLQALLYDRERMSRDLHDGTIQSLYAIGLGLGRLRRALTSPQERERLEANLVELDHVVAELRSYLVALDPGVSPVQSATTALEELIARLRHTTATELRFAADPGVGDGWPPAAVLDLLLAAREGVSNALRHGRATQVELALQRAGGGQVLFTLADNGRGFDPATQPRNGGHGLANLERRARAWNGSLAIESRPGGPTRLTLALYPLGSDSSS